MFTEYIVKAAEAGDADAKTVLEYVASGGKVSHITTPVQAWYAQKKEEVPINNLWEAYERDS